MFRLRFFARNAPDAETPVERCYYLRYSAINKREY